MYIYVAIKRMLPRWLPHLLRLLLPRVCKVHLGPGHRVASLNGAIYRRVCTRTSIVDPERIPENVSVALDGGHFNRQVRNVNDASARAIGGRSGEGAGTVSDFVPVGTSRSLARSAEYHN